MGDRPHLHEDLPPSRPRRRARWPYWLAFILFLIMAAVVGYFR